MPQLLKVLIVDHNVEDVERLVEELRRAGFEPEWQRVDTEVDYLGRLQAGVNLVLSDYKLPEFTGLRALELLKQGGMDIPFILVSSIEGEDAAVAAMKQGATDYLVKKRLAHFGESVAQALESSRLRAERRRAEQQLLLQGTALETAADAVVITDVQGSILWVNPAFTLQSGYSPSEALGHTPRLLKSGKHDADFYRNLWQTLLAGKTWRGCFTNRRKDGTLYIDESTVTPVRSKDGVITHFVTIMNDVTERRAAQDALQSTHELLCNVLDHSPAVLYGLNVDGDKITPGFVSANITRLLGFEVTQTLGADWWVKGLHPDDRSRAIGSITEALSFGVSRVEYRIQHQDGGYRWVEDNLRLARTQLGGPSELAGVWTDITERKVAEEAFAESERRLRELLENVALMAVTLDRRGVVTFCNNHLLRVTGWQRSEVVGTDWFEKFIPASDLETRKLFFDVMDVGSLPSHHENPIKTKSGEIREAAWNNTILRDTAGNTVGMASIGEDVTDRRRADADLRGSEERFRQVVENIYEVFWMIDVRQNSILYVSPGYEAIWGRSCESLYASPGLWAENIDERDRVRVKEAARTKQILGQYDETYRIVRPDGTVRWVRDRAFPVKEKNGVSSRIVGIAEDITEHKNLEEQCLRAQRLESIGMLAAGIAHDLNNVLAPIVLVAPLLRPRATHPADLRLLDTLERCAARGAGLVRQILGFVHGIGEEPRVVQVQYLLHDIIGVMVETFPKAVHLVDLIPNGLWPILANPTQIHQVLLNLCVNARDAMPLGGTLTLRAENVSLNDAEAGLIEGAVPGAWLVLHVEDTGTGIPDKVLARIWDPFFTTKTAEKGTGLGLSTVRGIVETHHGFVTLSTEWGRGSVFRVYLPADQSGLKEATTVALPPSTHAHGEWVLLVDDEELIRETARSILTQAGYRVITAVDGKEAMKVFQVRWAEISLVITDRDMPIVDGAGLVQAIHGQAPGMKILLISGLDSPKAHAEINLEKQVDAFIAKPFSAESLLNAVENLLSGCVAPM